MDQRVTIWCKAVLFDMDGTLVDSTAVVEQGWAKWASRYGLQLDSILRFSHGRPASATMEHFLPGQDHAADIAELVVHEETNLQGVIAIPGAAEFVNAVQGHPWAIVTSAWRKLATARVGAAGLPIPEVLVPVDEISKGKPDPEGFLKAAETLGVQPKDCLVFEDTRPGIDAALRAGMQVVGLLTTMPAEQLQHELLVQDFRSVSIVPQGDRLAVSLVIANRP
ncbi:HAD-IA family hydrolase [Terriglobus sp. RCC_193]|uniref:HAD-IA family hydrolase n=1 Tax=Terriglobus sp. RCC_193 TaxID=3239218 RepID=UPI003524CE24